jgi:hypothetical protein
MQMFRVCTTGVHILVPENPIISDTEKIKLIKTDSYKYILVISNYGTGVAIKGGKGVMQRGTRREHPVRSE